MRRLHIIVLIILVLFPMTGCIGDSDEETEGAEDSSNTSTVNHYHNNTTIINHQYHNNSTTSENVLVSNETTNWFTSGGTFNSKWNMDGVTENGYFCTEVSEQGFCSLGRIHSLWGENNLTVWNLSECTGQGGHTITDSFTHIAPICVIDFMTINTSAGQAIIVHEFNEISIESTCNGVVNHLNATSMNHSHILTGSAMNCTHVLYQTLQYDTQDSYQPASQAQDENPSVWSIVYEIKDVTVGN